MTQPQCVATAPTGRGPRRRRHRISLAAVVAMAAAALTVPFGSTTSFAAPSAGGPVVLDGMDPVCHSEVGQSTDGYIRTVLASLTSQARNVNDGGVVILGSGASTATCGRSLSSMMSTYLSAISPTPGVTYYGAASDIDTFFTSLAQRSVHPAAIWIPDNGATYSPSNPVQIALSNHASDLADFVNAGGGLFSNLGAYGWLTALLPNAVFNRASCNGGPAVTGDGHTAFPDLTDQLVQACWHGYFTGDTGGLVPLVDWPYPSTTSPRVAIAIGGSSVSLPSNFVVSAPDGPQPVDATVQVTAVAKNAQNNPLSGIPVAFNVDSGPDVGRTATVTTNQDGVATFAIVGSGAGSDAVTAQATINGSIKSASTSISWLPLPAAPHLEAVAGDTAIDVTVSPASGDEVSAASGIMVTLQPGEVTRTVPVLGGAVTFTGLTNGTAYTISAVTANAVGSSDAATTTATPHPPYTTPGTPTIATSAADGSVTVTITPPVSDGGAPISNYAVVAEPGHLVQTIDAADGGKLTFADLVNGTSYTFTAVATNVAGPGDAVSVTETPFTIPNAPVISGATSGSHTSTVSVAAPRWNGGMPITGYTVTAQPGGHIQRLSDASGGEVTFDDLDNGTTYTFTAVAHNLAGSSTESVGISTTPSTVAAAPALADLTTWSHSVSVRIVPPASDGGAAIDHYTVTLEPGDAVQEVGPAGGVVSFTDLANGVPYTVGAVAHNANGDSLASPSLAATPVGPAAGPGARAKSQPTVATVRIEEPIDDGGAPVRSYRVTASAPGLPSRVVEVAAGSSSVAIPGLRPGTRYRVTIVAVNDAGASAPTVLTLRTAPAPRGVPLSDVAGVPIAPGVRATLSGDGLFAYGSAQLTAAAKRQLQRAAPGLMAAHRIRCEGYTDFGGSRAANVALSKARAEAVCSQLRADGVTAVVAVVAYGDSRPVIRSGPREQRAQNRRVVVVFVK